MKSYIKPEFEIKSLVADTAIANGGSVEINPSILWNDSDYMNTNNE